MAYDVLRDAGYNVFVKVHPGARRPGFLDKARVTWLPQHLPFELIHFHELSIIVGIDGGAMVDKIDTVTISLLKMVSAEDAAERVNILYLQKNPAMRFAESDESFRKIVMEIG